MGKGNGSTRASASNSPKGLSRSAEIKQIAEQQMRALNEANQTQTKEYTIDNLRKVNRNQYEADNSPYTQGLNGYVTPDNEAYISEVWSGQRSIAGNRTIEYQVDYGAEGYIGDTYPTLRSALKALNEFIKAKNK